MDLSTKDLEALAEAISQRLIIFFQASKIVQSNKLPHNQNEFSKLVKTANESGNRADKEAVTEYIATHDILNKGGTA